MNTNNDPPKNPYAAPQAELDRAKPRDVCVRKFNGKLALWSGLVIGTVLLALLVPSVQTDRDPPRSTANEVFKYTIIVMISAGLGLAIGSNSEATVLQEPSETDTEEPAVNEPPP